MSKKKSLKPKLIDGMEFRKEMRCSQQEVEKWIAEGMPVHGEKYDLEECQRWHREGWFEQHGRRRA